jgi:hypothetical protein
MSASPDSTKSLSWHHEAEFLGQVRTEVREVLALLRRFVLCEALRTQGHRS